MNSGDLLSIRATNLGGFQLTSNPILRSRIKNYVQHFLINISLISLEYIRTYFSQVGIKGLNLGESKLEENEVTKLLELLPELEEITLSIIYIYIYI